MSKKPKVFFLSLASTKEAKKKRIRTLGEIFRVDSVEDSYSDSVKETRALEKEEASNG